MDIQKLLAELKGQRRTIDRAIAALKALESRPIHKSKTSGKGQTAGKARTQRSAKSKALVDQNKGPGAEIIAFPMSARRLSSGGRWPPQR